MSSKPETDMTKIWAGFTAMNESKQTLKHGKLITYLDNRASKFLSDVCIFLSGYTASHTDESKAPS
jgi:hypothetical protein